MSTDTVEEHRAASRVDQPTTSAAALTAMGIVYGDLGTSPLYTLQAVAQTFDGGLSASAALGSLSLIFWLLIITISIKYCLFVMRADNHGEGGILADVTHPCELARTRPGTRHHGPVRRGLDLWRWHHHAGDFGA